MKPGRVRVGVGGWSFAPWRDNFYPRGLPQAQELSFASRKLSAIEINATFYRTQTPDSFRRWAVETPGDFVFSIKAHRLTTHRKRLAESKPSIDHFLSSGLLELGEKLGPIVWQFAPTKKFEAEDFAAFLTLLPQEKDGRKLRHVLEVRHKSFRVEPFVLLARRHLCAICVAESDAYPLIPDLSADFIYARLQTSSASNAAGYSSADIDCWRDLAQRWAKGGEPSDLLPYATNMPAEKLGSRDVFIFFIAGAKEKNPAAACALIDRLTERA
jgi:uncharacterized protein YecE (DUF72 family)